MHTDINKLLNKGKTKSFSLQKIQLINEENRKYHN